MINRYSIFLDNFFKYIFLNDGSFKDSYNKYNMNFGRHSGATTSIISFLQKHRNLNCIVIVPNIYFKNHIDSIQREHPNFKLVVVTKLRDFSFKPFNIIFVDGGSLINQNTIDIIKFNLTQEQYFIQFA